MSTSSISGIDSVLNSIDPKSVSRKVTSKMTSTLNLLHVELTSAVGSKFTARNNLNKLLLAKRISFTETSITGVLVYKQQYSDLSKFPTTWRMGNINSEARRQGRVHTTEVVRGKAKIVYGKRHRGGFVLLGKGSKLKRYGRHGTQMVERKSKEKYPLHLLLGPSTNVMIRWGVYRAPRVRVLLDNIHFKLLQGLF